MFPGMQIELTNWSKSARSPCWVYKASDIGGIASGLAAAREQRLSVIPHGAGHSYTDAALNSGGVVIDVTPMRRILAWDAAQGILHVEPGVTLRDVVRATWKDGWWPLVTPSTPEVTMGGCAAMNVNGRNAWKCGPFGASVLSLEVLFPNGEACVLAPDQDPQLFHAVIGSLGLLGIVTSLTLQLERVASAFVTLRKRAASSLAGIFSLFNEAEQDSDFMEAWVDGFANGDQLGRGLLTCAALSPSGEVLPSPIPPPAISVGLGVPLVSLMAGLSQPVLQPAVQLFNQANYWSHRWSSTAQQRALFPYTFWPPAAFAGYHAMFPEGVETFQAFVPRQDAQEIFKHVLSYSQRHGYMPLWCVIKQHHGDAFLLSYQVDGFSLELNYQRTRQNAQELKQMLQTMIAMVIAAGGRFYLAKDHFLTHEQYRQSLGDEAVDAFLALKQRYDPEMLLQSDLFRRVFQPSS